MKSIELSALNGQTYFTSSFPDVLIQVPAGCHASVKVTCSGTEVMNEKLWPAGDYVRLVDLGALLEPYAQKLLVASLTIESEVLDEGESQTGSAVSSTASVLFARVDVGVTASDFYSNSFLSILQGNRTTAVGRKEILWYYGSGNASVIASYSDGTTQNFTPSVVSGSGAYTCIDVAPGNFVRNEVNLLDYIVTAGNRSQGFVVVPGQPDCAPILEFYNSFGVWEYIYCTGTHKVSPEYNRSSARINGMLRNYRIVEKRKFEADTGFLSTAMASWADELFRSDEVYVVNVINGEVVDHDGGKEVVITESKSEVTNEDDDMPHFSFTYQYAQRIHNVLHQNRVGRIFDNTFDHTFN